jgi:uncharacterized protein (TIGR00255 family)
MTGFGVGRAGDQTLSVVAEARSVNNRFLDISLRIPKGLYPFETEIRELIRTKVERGRVTLAVTEELSNGESSGVKLDREKATQYLHLLRELQELGGITGEIKLEHLLAAGDLFVSGDDDEARQRLWETAKIAILSALDDMAASGRREGDTLAKDLQDRLATIRDGLEVIKALAAGQTAEYRNRLAARLEQLIDDSRLDRNRLETELAISAERLDITEEIVRLDSHLNLFNDTLNKDGAIGKTLNFVLQEMGREVNTIASKSWLFDISQIAVRMKETLEQLREQVQNLE